MTDFWTPSRASAIFKAAMRGMGAAGKETALAMTEALLSGEPEPAEPDRTPMRERLIKAAEEAAAISSQPLTLHETWSEVSNWPEVIDAILEAMREPSEAAVEAGYDHSLGLCYADDQPGHTEIGRAFTAMIDHIRSGK